MQTDTIAHILHWFNTQTQPTKRRAFYSCPVCAATWYAGETPKHARTCWVPELEREACREDEVTRLNGEVERLRAEVERLRGYEGAWVNTRLFYDRADKLLEGTGHVGEHWVGALCAEVERLQTELADRDEMYRQIINEQCAPDEQHCSCVPSLRAEIVRLRDVEKLAVILSGSQADVIARLRAEVDGKSIRIDLLKEALTAIEWVREDGQPEYCPWCDNQEWQGHRADCLRQTALATWMQARGLSDAALAAALDCDRSFVFRLRTGQRALRPCVRCRFVARYGEEAAGAVFGAEDGHGHDAKGGNRWTHYVKPGWR